MTISKRFFKFIQTFRILSLLMTGGLGVFSLWIARRLLPCLFGDGYLHMHLVSNLTTLILSLPFLFVVWYLHTHDTKEQTEKILVTECFSKFIQGSRTLSLLMAGILGIFSAWIAHRLLPCLFDDELHMHLISNLTILILSLPVLFVLWYLRTHDTQEQIKKAEMQVKESQQSTSTSLLDMFLGLLFSENLDTRGAGLVQLTKLKNQGLFFKEIDLATRNINLCDPNLRLHINLNGMNLSEANLQNANLQNANLQNANLQGANLQGANLKNSVLQGAKLQGAIMQGADLRFAKLQGAKLQGATMQGVTMQNADLQFAKLQGANLQGTEYNSATKFPDNLDLENTGMVKVENLNLQGANLQNANLFGTNLQGADLFGAKLQGANLQGAKLQGANLQTANLQDTNLLGTNLQDAKLQDANLQDANLLGANLQDADLFVAKLQGANLFSSKLQGADLFSSKLQGANLFGAELQGAKLFGAEYNSATKFPDNFDPQKTMMIKVEN